MTDYQDDLSRILKDYVHNDEFSVLLPSHYQRHINCMPSRLKSTVFIAAFRSLMLPMGGLDHLRQTVCKPVFEIHVLLHAIMKTTTSH